MAAAGAIMPSSLTLRLTMTAIVFLSLASPSSSIDGGTTVSGRSVTDHSGVRLNQPEPLVSAAKMIEIVPDGSVESDSDRAEKKSPASESEESFASDTSPLLREPHPTTLSSNDGVKDETSLKPDELPSNGPSGSSRLNATPATQFAEDLTQAGSVAQHADVVSSEAQTASKLALQEVSTAAAQDSTAGTPSSVAHFVPVDADSSQDAGSDSKSIRAGTDVNTAASDGGANIGTFEKDAALTRASLKNSAGGVSSDESSPVGTNNSVPNGNNNSAPIDSNNSAPIDNNTSSPIDNNNSAPIDDNNSAPIDNEFTRAPVDNINVEGSLNHPEVADSGIRLTGDLQSDTGFAQQGPHSGEAKPHSGGAKPQTPESKDALHLLSARKVVELALEEGSHAVDRQDNEGIRSGRRSRMEDYLTVAAEDLVQQTGSDLKPGRCPTRVLSPELCPEGVADQCHGDSDCSGGSKCCSTGCARVCVRPLNSACELQRENTLRRGRALGLSDAELSEVPRCDDLSGSFVEVQCSTDYCYCANPETGYEVPGTRARSMHEVNCSNPLPCAGYQCRMLCPYQFSLDAQGCPLCRCRDPCEGVACPEGTSCVLQETSCTSSSCPPLPTCQKPASLLNLCPLGAPLMVGDAEDRPFLCGDGPNGPTCPTLYKCHVTEGHDYGVCCADVDKLVKPGTCPLDATTPRPTNPPAPNKDPLQAEVDAVVLEEAEELRCGVSCSHDLQCPSTQKCCVSDICGQHCIQPANLTVCMHQRMIAELLIVSEREGRGYVPQCRHEDGLYNPRQCSRNGLVCWCVDPEGAKLPRSIGPAEEVTCDRPGASVTPRVPCPALQCGLVCDYGYESDDAGCAVCQCARPCQDVVCPTGARCVMTQRCDGANCAHVPQCEYASSTQDVQANRTALPYGRSGLPSADASPAAPTGDLADDAGTENLECPLGLAPLSVGGMILQCDEHNPCPPEHFCTMPAGDRDRVRPFCCPMPKQIESTKAGRCPYLGDADESLCVLSSVCSSDDHCGGAAKCCVVPACGGPVCVGDHELSYSDQAFLQGPTMCEYLRDLVLLEGLDLAVSTPTCDADGAYERVQCNELDQCWCVDDYGSPLPGTRVSSRSLVTCQKLRESLTCGEVLCRLGCDYGFVLDPDTACPLCMCRNPCQDVECGPGSTCELVDIPCVDGICPPIPQCVPQPRRGLAPSCPKGDPYTVPGTNDSLTCSPRARALECPRGFSCVAQENDVEGVCCLTESAGSGKQGQCPFLVPATSQSCDLECSSDAHCEGAMKCCSNGCGMHCVAPIMKTACQHQRTLLEHRAREAGVPARRVYLPECTGTGDFARVQCHPGTTTCWCVDDVGLEVPGTRVSEPAHPNCRDPATCPDIECDLACLHGLALDARGCPTCTCRDPCEEVTCDSPLEECRIVHVACVGEPCPPLPVCLPKIDNPCPTGTPLNVNGTLLQCGPEGTVCPSSHKCHLSPLGEYALCCRKPREVCYEPRDSGFCEGSIRRWHFDAETNECRSFRFGGCGGNLNNFESEVECRNACPVLSSCEKLRAKNIQKAEKNKRMTFIPKCEKGTGAWLPEQCLEELGVCWCVTPVGDQVEGSLTRGAPDCSLSPRQARRLDVLHPDNQGLTNAICDEKETVHVCPKDMCENKVCLSHPTAVCRINPCNGCNVEFVDHRNEVVSCSEHLTPCQRDLQDALNSPASHSTLEGSSRSDVLYENNVVFDYLHNADVYFSPPALDEDPTPSPTAFGSFQSRSPSNSFDGARSPEYLRSMHRSPTAAKAAHERAHFARHFEFVPPGVSHHDGTSAEDRYAVETGGRDAEGDIITPDGVFIAPDGGVVAPNGVFTATHRAGVDGAGTGGEEEVGGQGRLLRSRRSASRASMNDDALVMPMVSSAPPQPRLDETDERNFASVDYDLAGNSTPKPGTCPNPAADVSLLTCEPRQECLQDSHCPGSAKCCFTGCGSACLQPLEIPFSSSGMQAAVPMCERDGSYSRTQSSRGWSWCVDSRGAPLHHTLTRGHVRCGPQGQILERAPQSAVCPTQPGATPRVCARECRNAVCPAHPDAVCVADPCNNCRIAFFSPSGEQVHCEDECSQPLTTGMCRASIRRFFHNSSSGRCEEFHYGGCQGNDNNFPTMDECRHRCERPAQTCQLPVRPGACVGGETRWYYSAPAQACLPFLYTGCGGNANNFPTKLHCEAACPEMVLCPLWSAKTMEPTPCSRTRACHNATCHGYPQAVCVVEPCTCQPYFTDQHGQTVECQRPTVPPKTILAFSYEHDLPDKLSAEELSGSKESGVLYLEGEPSVGRCELLHRHLLTHQGPPSQRHYLPQCDAKGGFLPTQCYTGAAELESTGRYWTEVDSGSESLPRCWCVDETGKRTHPSAYFLRGQRECEPVMVESVVVTLGFHGHKVGLDHLGRRHEKEIREQISDLLSSLSPVTVDGQVAIVDLPDVTQVKFTLKGQGKMDAAYKLEDKVRRGDLALHLAEKGRRVPADKTASWFHHQVEPSLWQDHSNARTGLGSGGSVPREVVVTQVEQREPAFLGTSVVITVVSAVLLCALVVALVLYRRHIAGTYAKSSHGSTQSLAFSDSSLDRRSISSGKFCAQLEHPKLNAKIPSVTTIENEFRAVTRH